MDFFASLSGIQKVYLICAFLGGIVFVARMLLMFLGGDHDGDHDFDADHGGDAHDHGDTDASFRLLSIQGLTGFFMMFGLVGMATSYQMQIPDFWSLVASSLAGTAMMVALGLLTSFMMNLQSSGNINYNNSIGAQGSVYLTIPKGGTGKVQIAIQERLMTLDAMAEDKEARIATGDRVEVLRVMSGNVLVVKAI